MKQKILRGKYDSQNTPSVSGTSRPESLAKAVL
jgi:hypothetical protein